MTAIVGVLASPPEVLSGNSLSSQTVGLSPVLTVPGSVAVGGLESLTVEAGALVSESGPVGTMADVFVIPQNIQISVYEVREGDTLSEIAEMFGVSNNTIVWANDLKNAQSIKAGQTLVILPVSGVRHAVAAGETIETIARKYRGDVKDIVQFNGLDQAGLIVSGQTLVIPDGELEIPAPRRLSQGVNQPPSTSAGYYLRPIQGGVKTRGIHGYNGVDLAAAAGSPLFAAADGRVIVSRENGWNGGYGNYIVIDHQNGTQTLYSHNRDNLVAAGQWVAKGQVIGHVGSTGRSTGPHVHFEVRGAKNPF